MNEMDRNNNHDFIKRFVYVPHPSTACTLCEEPLLDKILVLLFKQSRERDNNLGVLVACL